MPFCHLRGAPIPSAISWNQPPSWGAGSLSCASSRPASPLQKIGDLCSPTLTQPPADFSSPSYFYLASSGNANRLSRSARASLSSASAPAQTAARGTTDCCLLAHGVCTMPAQCGVAETCGDYKCGWSNIGPACTVSHAPSSRDEPETNGDAQALCGSFFGGVVLFTKSTYSSLFGILHANTTRFHAARCRRVARSLVIPLPAS